MRNQSLVSLLLLTFAGVPQGIAEAQSARELSTREQAIHAVSRLTFGARAYEVDRVAAMGVDQWIAQQLKPQMLKDSVVDAALAPLYSWSTDAKQLRIVPRVVSTENMMTSDMSPEMRNMMGTRALPDTIPVRRMRAIVSYSSSTNEFVAGKIIRAQLSERQLEELMAEFWLNHFSVSHRKMPSPQSIVIYVRDDIRPHTLGKFRNLLGAVAHSPAMLSYLDNLQNRTDSMHRSLQEYKNGKTTASRGENVKRLGINENYARELLELHTMGADGGYTQNDVINVARALTGWWSLREPQGASAAGQKFVFSEEMHDAERKSVLGREMPEGRGVEDGEEVLDIIARHPSTARFIATKLARRFVSDSPPPALIARAADTFSKTDGDIAETLRTIFTSDEFFSRSAFRAKVKSPLELMVSTMRALNAPADTSLESSRSVANMGHPTFGYETPEGWPDYASTWMNAYTMFGRLAFAEDVAKGRLKHLPTANWEGWRTLSDASLEMQVNGVINLLFNGVIDAATRKQLLATQTPATVVEGSTPARARLREILEVALSSPDFQRR